MTFKHAAVSQVAVFKSNVGLLFSRVLHLQLTWVGGEGVCCPTAQQLDFS